MSIPSLADILGGTVSDAPDYTPVPVGDYSAVITGVEVRKGKKSNIPYLNIEATIFMGEHETRKVWGMSSFSENSTGKPGGLTQLLQSTGAAANLDPNTDPETLPAVLALALKSSPVTITTKLEHEGAAGDKKYNDDGTPKMRANIESYTPPSEEFLSSFANEVAGVDDDVPF